MILRSGGVLSSAGKLDLPLDIQADHPPQPDERMTHERDTTTCSTISAVADTLHGRKLAGNAAEGL